MTNKKIFVVTPLGDFPDIPAETPCRNSRRDSGRNLRNHSHKSGKEPWESQKELWGQIRENPWMESCEILLKKSRNMHRQASLDKFKEELLEKSIKILR